MLMMIKAGIKRLLAGPATKQYRVTYGGDDVWRLEGWHMEMRGPGGGPLGWIWISAHSQVYSVESIAVRDAIACAKRDGGEFVE